MSVCVSVVDGRAAVSGLSVRGPISLSLLSALSGRIARPHPGQNCAVGGSASPHAGHAGGAITRLGRVDKLIVRNRYLFLPIEAGPIYTTMCHERETAK